LTKHFSERSYQEAGVELDEDLARTLRSLGYIE
jgi:hypothetical protein